MATDLTQRPPRAAPAEATMVGNRGKIIGLNDLMFVSKTAMHRGNGPFKLTIALTWVCDQQCKHCSIWSRPRSPELNPGQWRQVFRSARRTLNWLDLTGGEVTTRPDFAEIALAAIEELPNLAMLHFPTNGRRPTRLESVVKAIMTGGPRRLVVSLSLDGPPDVHAEVRGDERGFEQTVESFQRLRKLGIEAYFGLTVSSLNIQYVDAAYDALQERIPNLSWSDLHVNILHESAHYFGNTGIGRPDSQKVHALIRSLIHKRGLPTHPTHLMERLYLRRVGDYLKSGRSPVPCTSLRGNAFIDPTGQVYPCHIWDEPIGDLNNYNLSLPRLWSSHRRIELRDRVKAEKCPGCWTPCEAYPSIMNSLPSSLWSTSGADTSP
ncbi:MAG: radical SAM protein [Myxococcota bacterium]|nr:radical SAM protein [Myxococcota bacterium]